MGAVLKKIKKKMISVVNFIMQLLFLKKEHYHPRAFHYHSAVIKQITIGRIHVVFRHFCLILILR